MRWLVYQELHERMGDLRADRVYQLAKDKFYWAGNKIFETTLTTNVYVLHKGSFK